MLFLWQTVGGPAAAAGFMVLAFCLPVVSLVTGGVKSFQVHFQFPAIDSNKGSLFKRRLTLSDSSNAPERQENQTDGRTPQRDQSHQTLRLGTESGANGQWLTCSSSAHCSKNEKKPTLHSDRRDQNGRVRSDQEIGDASNGRRHVLDQFSNSGSHYKV